MVVDVAAVAQGINGCVGTESGDGLAIGVIPVAGGSVAVDIHQPDHVALGVGDVVVDIAVLQQHEGMAVLVIEEVQDVVPIGQPHQLAAGVVIGVHHTVDRLGGPQTFCIIGEAQALGAVGGSSHFPSMLPSEAPAIVVACGIADGVISNGSAIVSSQQIAPVAVAVGVSVGRSVLDRLGDIACIVVGVAKIAFLPGGECGYWKFLLVRM